MNFRIKQLDKNYNSLNVFKLFNYDNNIYLDSAKLDSKLGRYSFIGVNVLSTFMSRGHDAYIDGNKVLGEPFEVLEKLISKYNIAYDSDIPFVGGLVGYFSYDMGRILEELPDTSESFIDIPDSIFYLYENIIIFDHKNNKTYITALGFIENSIENIYNTILNKYSDEELEIELGVENTEFYSNFTKEEYIKAISSMREYIRNGDMYIANMTRDVWCDNYEDSFTIYEKLRTINPAPFAAYMDCGDFQIISSSPERFMYVQDRKAYTRPIKGTRPRGYNIEEDNKNREELLNSEKDKSELLMIVDLERNDLSKVCKASTVKVTELFKIEEYATVFHLVSEIEGVLEDNVSSIRCIKECYPGGSITGAPKIRAMEIIEELEGLKRNIYTGCIGYFDIRGNCDFNIAIRTIIKKENKAYFGVGGGITYESDAEAEWYETIDKAKALMRVL